MKQSTKQLFAGALVGATVMVAGSAFAAHGGQLAQEARDAISANDFAAFQVATEGTRLANISEEVFEQKVERAENKEAKRAAVESGDYDAFVALIPEGRDAPSVEVFNLLGDLHEARDAEDKDAVSEIKAELADLGFEKKERKGKRGFGLRGNR